MNKWSIVNRALSKSGGMALTVIAASNQSEGYVDGIWLWAHTERRHEFAQHINRWRHVTIRLYERSPLKEMLELSGLSAPLLEELVITSDNRRLFGGGAPRLRPLTLGGLGSRLNGGSPSQASVP